MRKFEISKTVKYLYYKMKILQESESKRVAGVKDKRKLKLVDLMAHRNDVDGKHYIRKKNWVQLLDCHYLERLCLVSTKSSTAFPLNLSKLPTLSPNKVWIVWNIFEEELRNNTVILEMVHEKLAWDKT